MDKTIEVPIEEYINMREAKLELELLTKENRIPPFTEAQIDERTAEFEKLEQELKKVR